MKLIALFFLTIFLGCNHTSIELISSEKQNIVPGVQSEKPYTNYVFEVKIKEKTNIHIDSVLVYQREKQCLRIKKYFIKKEKTAQYVPTINEMGKYYIHIPLKENNFEEKKDCIKLAKDALVIYYVERGKMKTLNIDSFAEKQVRKR